MRRGWFRTLAALIAGSASAWAWPSWPEDLRAAYATIAPIAWQSIVGWWHQVAAGSGNSTALVTLLGGTAGLLIVVAARIVSARRHHASTAKVPSLHMRPNTPMESVSAPSTEEPMHSRVGRLARQGRTVSAIAAETRLSQDAIRLLLATR